MGHVCMPLFARNEFRTSYVLLTLGCQLNDISLISPSIVNFARLVRSRHNTTGTSDSSLFALALTLLILAVPYFSIIHARETKLLLPKSFSELEIHLYHTSFPMSLT